MLANSAALAMVLWASACVAAVESEPTEHTGDNSVHVSVERSAATAQDDVCELLPDCGPCSLLCDREALVEEHVPPQTCVAFVCELTDGRQVTAHACAP